MSHFTRLGAVCVLAAFFDESSFAGTINVPADVSTIQGAIDSAVAGDVVLVAPGTYFENIDFKGKAIEVRSSGGPSVTAIDGGGVNSVVRLVSGEDAGAVLAGFTITNGFSSRGAGIHVENSSPTIVENIVTKNNATPGCCANGGGIAIWNASPIVERNVISQNSVTGDGGGFVIAYDSVPTFAANIVANNYASGNGGGIYTWNYYGTLEGSTFIGNTGSAGGSAIFCGGPSWPTISNCIVRQNAPHQIVHEWGGVTVDHCNVEGGWPGAGNIDADPIFVDPSNANYHVSSGSPCIDAGNGAAPTLSATDVDGDQRVIGAGVDVGADEFTLVPNVSFLSPDRVRYDAPSNVVIHGGGFSKVNPISVRFGTTPATNVTVLDDSTLTCDLPLGDPGPVEVGVANAYGEGVLVDGFTYSPALLITGDPVLGGTLTLDFYCDALNAIYAIAGFPPAVSLKTKPFDGTLCIDPSYLLFWVPLWPFDQFTLQVDIPNDSSLSGMTLLSQALIGPRLGGRNKDGAWTNCVTVTIQ